MLTLYGLPKTRSDRALWALEEKGTPYKFEYVHLGKGEGRTPEFLALNPAGKIPLLVDGDLIVSESIAICNYIADRCAGKAIAPAFGSNERAHYDQWCSFAISELEQPLWTMAKHKFALPEEKRVPAVMDTARWEFTVAAQRVAKGLEGREFILGKTFSVADILLGHTLKWARAFDVPTEQATVDAYADRLFARPAFIVVKDYPA
ncbi:MAG TPA: glutathione S-transferase family protein [Pseudomonadales bacterium]|nr:glutathione S-transferase family protein [Pseudomonadales bacterium]